VNVTSSQQAVVLLTAREPARRELHSDGNAALKAGHGAEAQRQVALLPAPPETSLILARSDHFSRSGESLNDLSYSDPRASRRGERPAESSVIRHYISQNSNSLQTQNQLGLYASIQGMDTEVVIGTHIDVYA
jgi:hypothetical protein